MINNKTELLYNDFNRLRSNDWLNNWLIIAVIDILDKPFFVRYGMSVPLDEVRRTRNIKLYERPLARWAKDIDEFRK